MRWMLSLSFHRAGQRLEGVEVPGMNLRIATEDDREGIASILAGAFAEDPVWGWALPEPDAREEFWSFFAGSALRYPWTWIAGDFAAVSVWIPPGGQELTSEEETAIEPLLLNLIGPRCQAVIELLKRFDSNRPGAPAHYYLSLLGTHPDHRGRGLGMALLAENLKTIDLERLPAYLESTNVGNLPRYERQGFRRIGDFDRPDGRSPVTTMWRDAR